MFDIYGHKFKGTAPGYMQFCMNSDSRLSKLMKRLLGQWFARDASRVCLQNTILTTCGDARTCEIFGGGTATQYVVYSTIITHNVNIKSHMFIALFANRPHNCSQSQRRPEYAIKTSGESSNAHALTPIARVSYWH